MSDARAPKGAPLGILKAMTLRVVDLYCGVGGFSCGALEAGGEVILGVDCDSVPLRLWASNVPDAQAVLTTLGPRCADLELPPPAPDLHVHLSPPCQAFSRARASSATQPEVQSALELLRWSIDLVLSRGDFSWSLEEVPVPTVRLLLQEYAKLHPTKVAWAVFDCADFGCPQNRQRLIAGPPGMIRKLQESPVERRISVKEAFERAGLTTPSSFFKNNTTNRDKSACTRSTEECAFTVCAGQKTLHTPHRERDARLKNAGMLLFPSFVLSHNISPLPLFSRPWAHLGGLTTR